MIQVSIRRTTGVNPVYTDPGRSVEAIVILRIVYTGPSRSVEG